MENKNVLKRYNLPEEIKFCKKCTVSNQRPRIKFNQEGICSACVYSVEKNTKFNWEQRELELRELCKRFKRNDGGYEVLVPASGGKDSAFVAHELKHKYGMKVLTVTWAPHIYTMEGFQNFQNMIHVGGLDNVLGTPNGIIHRKLTKLSLEILGDPFQPFIYGQTNFPLQIALKYKIPLIMYGENGEVEYGGDMTNAYKPTRDYASDHTKHYFSGIDPEAFTQYGISKDDMLTYMAPPTDELVKNKTEIHFYGYYRKWVPQENYYYCVEHTGFKPHSVRNEGTYSKYASFDDKIDGFHYYLGFIKFGIGRCTSDTAHEIRDQHLTREEGVELVKKFDGEFPARHHDLFLKYCDITNDYLTELTDSWRSPHIWGKDAQGNWKLRRTAWNGGLDDKGA